MTTYDHHPVFYFENLPGCSIFAVENFLYRIPRDTLSQQSDLFKDILGLPLEEGSLEGQHDDHPIILPETAIPDFDLLLSIVFPG
jgi:hypothetical protein